MDAAVAPHLSSLKALQELGYVREVEPGKHPRFAKKQANLFDKHYFWGIILSKRVTFGEFTSLCHPGILSRVYDF